MGLAERRAIEAIKGTEYKQFVEDVKGLLGHEVVVDVDWASIETHSDFAHIIDTKKAQRYFFEYTINALRSVAGDDMGKSALQEKLKSIHFVNQAGDLTFADGKLTVNSSLDGNGVYGDERIKDVLEAGL